MKNNLYHGTYEDAFIKIYEDGKIKNKDIEKDSNTIIIDNCITKYGDIFTDIRKDCIYLTDDKMCVIVGFDCYFDIPVCELDCEKLYVAENRYLDNVLCVYYDDHSNQREENLKKYVNKYLQSIKPYNEYADSHLEYESPEYIYKGDISIDSDIYTDLYYEILGEYQEIDNLCVIGQ